LKKEIEESLISKIENFSSTFWKDVNYEYFQYFAAKMFPLKNFLREYYNMNNEEIIEFAKIIETEVYNNIKKDFSKKTKEISAIGIDIFKKRFWYEKENVQRMWNRLEEEEIETLYKKHRGELTDLFDNLKFLKIIKNPLKCINNFLIFQT
jgi:hypothetical protein